MNTNRSKTTAKMKDPEYDAFSKDYTRRNELFCGEAPTEKDLHSTWECLKHEKRKKRVTPKPPITKEAFFHELLRGCRMCDEIPTAREFNRLWDLIEFERQYQAIRGKDKEQRKIAFLVQMEQEIKRRYPSTDSSNAGFQGETKLEVWEPPIQKLHDLYTKVKYAKPETTSRSQLDQFYEQFLILQEARDNIGVYQDAIEDYLLAIETMFYCADSRFVEKSSRHYDLTRYSGKRGGRGY